MRIPSEHGRNSPTTGDSNNESKQLQVNRTQFQPSLWNLLSNMARTGTAGKVGR